MIYEKVNPFSGVFDYYGGPFRFEQHSSFDRLRGWKNIKEIAVAGNTAAGLCEDGTVFCTEAEDENQPLEGITDGIALEVKDGRIYVVCQDWSMVRIAGEEKEDEESLLYF